MKHRLLLPVMLIVLLGSACKKAADVTGINTIAGILPNGSTLPAIINSQIELVANGTYYLDGKTYVLPGGDLVINAGVTVKGLLKATPAEASALIVTRGGQVHADGTNGTIVFTSNSATPAPGDWGGVAILGSAPTNQSNPVLEGVDVNNLPAGVDVHYGGLLPNNSSGVLRFVRIEWAGTGLFPDNELNSLTLAGVGAGTVIDHIQASYGRDDAFQFFGGTVNPSYLIALSPNDDVFDFEFGYTGTVQYVIGVLRAGLVYSGASAIESDNEPSGTCPAITPVTHPKILNGVFIGGKSSPFAGTLYAVHVRRASLCTITNSIFLGYNTGIVAQGGCSGMNFTDNVLHAFTNLGPVPSGNETYLNATSSNADIGLVAPFPGVPFDPSETMHPGKGAIVNGDYWYLGWSTGL